MVNHPFWGIRIYGNPQITKRYIYIHIIHTYSGLEEASQTSTAADFLLVRPRSVRGRRTPSRIWPRHWEGGWCSMFSMYGLFTYICVFFLVNVYKHSIHGACGMDKHLLNMTHALPKPPTTDSKQFKTHTGFGPLTKEFHVPSGDQTCYSRKSTINGGF